MRGDIIPNAVPPLAYMNSYILLTHQQAAGLINLKMVRYCTECFSYHQRVPIRDIQEYYPGILQQGRIKNWFTCTAEPSDGDVHSQDHDNRRSWDSMGGPDDTILG